MVRGQKVQKVRCLSDAYLFREARDSQQNSLDCCLLHFDF
jgi:hypothetical protein